MARTPSAETPLNKQALSVKPLHARKQTPKMGRPARLVMPAMPQMAFSPDEQALFDFFIEAYKEQYPDMVPTDHLLLHLAGIEFIKYLRVAAEEIDSGKIISMARQHPGVQMRSLLDQLSVTRKARLSRTGKDEESAEDQALRDFFMRPGRKA